MSKTILITGSTDGLGLATAARLASEGHRVLMHGRSAAKLEAALAEVNAVAGGAAATGYTADLSHFDEVESLAEAVASDIASLDVLLNNAGIFRTPDTITRDGLDVRFAVNTLAPCLLTQRMLPQLGEGSRIVNLGSAAQAPVSLAALRGETHIADHFQAYAESKLAMTMWSRRAGVVLKASGRMMVAVNPASMLASKMVKEGFGVAGNDLGIGVDILCRAALSDEFADAGGKYFDNDAGRFSSPHPDALDEGKVDAVLHAMEDLLARLGHPLT